MFQEMRSWDPAYLHDVTGSYHPPCWSSDPLQASDTEKKYLSHIGYDLQNLGEFPSISKHKNPYRKDKAQQTWAQVAKDHPQRISSTPVQSQTKSSSSPVPSNINKSQTALLTEPNSPDPNQQINDNDTITRIQELATRLGHIERLHHQVTESIQQKQEISLQAFKSEVNQVIQQQSETLTAHIHKTQEQLTTTLQEQQHAQSKTLWTRIEDKIQQEAKVHNTTASATNDLLHNIAASISHLQTTLSNKISYQSDLINECIVAQSQFKKSQENLERRYDRIFDDLTTLIDIPAEPHQNTGSELVLYDPPSPHTLPSKSKIPRNSNTTHDPMDTSLVKGKRTSSDAQSLIIQVEPPSIQQNRHTRLSTQTPADPFDQLPPDDRAQAEATK